METKKWPVLAQVLMALGVLGGIRGIFTGLAYQSVLDILFGVVGIAIFWNVYKLKLWALKALTVLLSLNILFLVAGILTGLVPILGGVVMIALNGLIIYYFNSKEIKILFAP